MEQYQAITETLKQNENLSLQLYFHDTHYGVKDTRYATIWEPNPDEGKIAGDGDQAYRLGPRHVQRGFEFRGREISEALNLLEKKCAGEKNVQNTVDFQKNSSFGQEDKTNHGYEHPQGMLDNWVVAGFRFKVQQNEDSLIAQVQSSNFNTKNIYVSEKIVQTVDEAIMPFQEYCQSFDTVTHIQRGALLRDQIHHYGKFEPHLKEQATETIQPELLQEYQQTIKLLKPLEINKEAEESLFISILMDQLFQRKD